MRFKCSGCDEGEPIVFCSGDDALFCLPCDQKVHVNTTSSKHKRVLLSFAPVSTRPKCDNCTGEPGHFLCLQDRSILCRDCDLALHNPNSVAAAHVRLVVMGARIGEINVPNFAPVNRGPSSSQSTVCSSVPPAGFQYGMAGISSSLSTASSSTPPARFNSGMDPRAAAKGGKTASNKKAGKRILGWDRTNSVQYPPMPHKRCAGMHSLYPQPQWTGTSNTNQVNPSSSPMPSMSLVLKPTYMPTPRFSPSDSSPMMATDDIPPNQQMGSYGQSNEIPAINISNTALDGREVLNSLPGNSNLNSSYYPSNQQYSDQIPFNQQQNDDFLHPILCDINTLLNDDEYGLLPVHHDNSEWGRYLQASEEFLNGENEDDAHDWSVSRQFRRVMMHHQEFLEGTGPSSSQPPPPLVSQQYPLDSQKGKQISFQSRRA